MKRKWKDRLGFLLIAIGICLAGCKGEEQTPNAPVQEAWTIYRMEYVSAYTLDAEGNLYTFEMEGESTDAKHYIKKYDTEGNCVYSVEVARELCNTVQALAIKDGVLYFAPQLYEEGKIYMTLYTFNLEDKTFTQLTEMPYYDQVSRIIPEEERIYLLGKKGLGSGVRSSNTYSYRDEKIMYYSYSANEVYTLGIEEPIDIGKVEDGNLIVYAHTEEGFCFFLYDAVRDAIKMLAKTDAYKMCNMTLANDAEEIIYQSSGRGLVVSSLSDLEVECELYPNGFFWDNSLCCVNGRVACMAFDGSIVQFNLKDVKKENRVLRYISGGSGSEEPYGCGYEMQRTKLEEDKFALKIMALDKDFDVCLVNTADSFSYNLRENGVFYPLNAVPGVQEYLDACFPYVREAATDEDGNIWMLPIVVSVPGIVVNEELADGGAFQMNCGMSHEDYFSAFATLGQEERSKIDMPRVAFWDEALRQYFAENTSVDTEEFRKLVRVFSEYWKELQGNGGADYTEMWHQHVIYETGYNAYYITQMGENARVYEVPKVSADSKNVGTCLFLAVNPYSDNLDATLDYIASWIAYTMEREDIPLFFKDRAAGDSVYESSLYELYQNGEIGFTLDADIYAGYEAVLEDSSKLEAYIEETERKLKIYLNE